MTVARIAALNDGWNAAAAARRSRLIPYASHVTSLTRQRRGERPDLELRRMARRGQSRHVVRSLVTDGCGDLRHTRESQSSLSSAEAGLSASMRLHRRYTPRCVSAVPGTLAGDRSRKSVCRQHTDVGEDRVPRRAVGGRHRR